MSKSYTNAEVAAVLEAARAAALKEERAAVVKYLRELAERPPFAGLTSKALLFAAGLIDRGEHV